MSWNSSSSMAIAHPAARYVRDVAGRVGLRRGLDVLVDVEGVVRVVTFLDPGEPVVVAAVGRPDPVLSLAHQEVDVGAPGRAGMQLLPVVAGPLRDAVGVGGAGVHPPRDPGPAP